MSKSNIQMTPAMRAEVERELQAAKKDADEQEERHFNAQACLDTMKMVRDCAHELEVVKAGKGEIISCKKCHFYWGVDKLLD